MDSIGFLEKITDSKDYRNQITCIKRIPSRKGVYVDPDPPIMGQVGEALKYLGITQLYSHQAQAVEAVRNGKNIVVVTSTASGKSLTYNIPVLEALAKDHNARALYIFPTKALAQDQLGKLNRLGIETLKAATYDGDTPKQERPFIKAGASIILTNPDMLHVGILPYHTTWYDLFRNLRYVVIDEIHMYRGVFGAHVANIIRRLRRIANHYGSNPQFICASATVNDPAKLMRDLTGVDAEVIDQDGSPRGEKVFTFWNPPYLAKTGERRSANSESVDLFTRLVESDIRTIVFTKARKTAELILRYARTSLSDENSPRADKIMAYRAGYTPAERRDIERRLFSGELIGVTSTTALEVGVDIGGLDAVIMTGYPGSIASAWQQAGRSGRGTAQSMAILVAQDDPVDQYLMRNPNYFFSASSERAIVDSQNPYILADHILCAAYELPLEDDEIETIFGERTWDTLSVLAEAEQLSYRGRWYYTGNDYPARNINIRSASNENYEIVSADKAVTLLGTVDGINAFLITHPGAVYLHGGESYIVKKLDIESKTVYVERTEVNYYTTPGSRNWAQIDEDIENKTEACAEVHFGDVTVGSQITHFWRKRLFSDENIEKVPLDLPEVELKTEAVWIIISQEMTDRLVGRQIDLMGSIHAIEHAAIGILPLIALCDRMDIGGVSNPSHPDTDGRPVIFIYDGHAGGVGIARAAYDSISELLEATLKAIEDCPCEDGCPSCIQSPKCGNNNEPLDKAGAVYLLRELLADSTCSGEICISSEIEFRDLKSQKDKD